MECLLVEYYFSLGCYGGTVVSSVALQQEGSRFSPSIPVLSLRVLPVFALVLSSAAAFSYSLKICRLTLYCLYVWMLASMVVFLCTPPLPVSAGIGSSPPATLPRISSYRWMSYFYTCIMHDLHKFFCKSICVVRLSCVFGLITAKGRHPWCSEWWSYNIGQSSVGVSSLDVGLLKWIGAVSLQLHHQKHIDHT